MCLPFSYKRVHVCQCVHACVPYMLYSNVSNNFSLFNSLSGITELNAEHLSVPIHQHVPLITFTGQKVVWTWQNNGQVLITVCECVHLSLSHCKIPLEARAENNNVFLVNWVSEDFKKYEVYVLGMLSTLLYRSSDSNFLGRLNLGSSDFIILLL